MREGRFAAALGGGGGGGGGGGVGGSAKGASFKYKLDTPGAPLSPSLKKMKAKSGLNDDDDIRNIEDDTLLSYVRALPITTPRERLRQREALTPELLVKAALSQGADTDAPEWVLVCCRRVVRYLETHHDLLLHQRLHTGGNLYAHHLHQDEEAVRELTTQKIPLSRAGGFAARQASVDSLRPSQTPGGTRWQARIAASESKWSQFWSPCVHSAFVSDLLSAGIKDTAQKVLRRRSQTRDAKHETPSPH